MASDNNKQQTEETGIDVLDRNLQEMGRQVAVNKTALYVAFGAIIVIAAATLCYIYFLRNPKIEKSYEAYNKVETVAMGNDSLAAAQYKQVADQYSGTDAGNLAALSAAEALYNTGKYEEAAKYLKQFKTKDEVLEANAEILLGDCYVNLKKYDQALEAFTTAVRKGEGNPQIVPRALLKKAVVYDAQKKYADALECYNIIKRDFPKFQLGNGISIDAYIEREKARIGK